MFVAGKLNIFWRKWRDPFFYSWHHESPLAPHDTLYCLLLLCFSWFTKWSADSSEDNGMSSCNSGYIFLKIYYFHIRRQECCQDHELYGSWMSHNRVSFNKQSRRQSFPVITNKPLSCDGDMISWWKTVKKTKKKHQPWLISISLVMTIIRIYPSVCSEQNNLSLTAKIWRKRNPHITNTPRWKERH